MAELKPDLTSAPQFSALTDWMGKLREWCEAAVVEIQSLEAHAVEQSEKLHHQEHMMQELRDDSEALASLRLMVEDHAKGIRDLSELVRHAEVVVP